METTEQKPTEMAPTSDVPTENWCHALGQETLDESESEERLEQPEEEVFAPAIKAAGRRRNQRGMELVIEPTTSIGKLVEKRTVLKVDVSHPSSTCGLMEYWSVDLHHACDHQFKPARERW